MLIYCCGCEGEVEARLTNGAEIYPHRRDLAGLPFWKCDGCKNYVGCHKRTNKPLGNIPTQELRDARKKIHALLDPLWKSGRMKRGDVYRNLSKSLGHEYHTGEIKTLEEARNVYRIVQQLHKANDP